VHSGHSSTEHPPTFRWEAAVGEAHVGPAAWLKPMNLLKHLQEKVARLAVSFTGQEDS